MEGGEEAAAPPASEDWGGVPAGSGPRAGRELASPSSSREVLGFISDHERSEVRHCGPSLSPFAANLLTGECTGSKKSIGMWMGRWWCALPANETWEAWLAPSQISSPTHAMSRPRGHTDLHAAVPSSSALKVSTISGCCILRRVRERTNAGVNSGVSFVGSSAKKKLRRVGEPELQHGTQMPPFGSAPKRASWRQVTSVRR